MTLALMLAMFVPHERHAEVPLPGHAVPRPAVRAVTLTAVIPRKRGRFVPPVNLYR